MKSELFRKVCLVTGSARGIGLSIADRFVANGANVVYSDVDEAEAIAASKRHAGCLGIRLDVTNDREIAAAIDRIDSEFGRLDVLVNNAGVNTIKHRVTLDEFPREEWDRILSVDLTGLFQVSQQAVRIMRRQGSGRIINIASIAGLVPLRLQCAFIAAKAGVVNLTKGMALELGPHGILVNGIAPGSTLTAGTKALFYGEGGKFKEHVQRMLDHVLLGRPRDHRRDRRGSPISGRSREQLHERPRPHRRRRLDGRVRQRFLRHPDGQRLSATLRLWNPADRDGRHHGRTHYWRGACL